MSKLVERSIDADKVWDCVCALFEMGADQDWDPPSSAIAMLAVACMVIGDIKTPSECPEFWQRVQRVQHYIVAEFAETGTVQ